MPKTTKKETVKASAATEKKEKVEKTEKETKKPAIRTTTKAGAKSKGHLTEEGAHRKPAERKEDKQFEGADTGNKRVTLSRDETSKPAGTRTYSRGHGHSKFYSYKRKRYCKFCAKGIQHIDYKDVAVLEKYLNQSLKIASRKITGACAAHQRRVSIAIKRARIVALIPYKKD